ncbi:MAG: hemin ABC transporter substrate-binding protein [Rubrivivax sp.]|jgi:iron complex transport system substrate-binding protein
MRPLLNPGRRHFQQALLRGAGAAALGLAAGPLRAQTPAPRIVSVGGALTETVYALGAEGLLVGADTTSLYPAAATRLPSVGYARALSAEGVLSLRPTRLLTGPEAGPPVVMRQLAAAGLDILQLDTDHRFEGLLQRTRQIGQTLGREAPAQALVATLQQQWTQTQAQVQQAQAARRGQPAPRVLFVLSHALNQVRVAGRDTAAHAMLGYAGLHNVMGEFSGYKPLTPEAVIAAAPDLVLVTDQGLATAGGVAGVLKAPGLAATPAGRQQRVLAMEALWLLGFGPRLPQAVGHLAQLCHGAMALSAPRA